MIEDIDYTLIKGSSWNPFGRKYKLIIPKQHWSGVTIPSGFEWDGGTGVPMRYNSPSATAFLEHDYSFGASGIDVLEANSKCVQKLYKDTGLFMAVVIAVMFTLSTPTIFGYFKVEEATKYKSFLRMIGNLVALFNVIAIIWGVKELLGF